MAPTLEKRKRVSREHIDKPSRSPTSPQGSSDEEDVQAIFRRAFEAKFKPLDPEPRKAKRDEPTPAEEVPDDSDSDSDWSGIASDNSPVEIISYSTSHHTPRTHTSKQETKAFMSSKPPSTTTHLQPHPQPSKPIPSSPDDHEAENTANDLALHRLLRESHLLQPNPTAQSLTPSGANRHKALDLRFQSLGAKTSIHAQEKMPMAHRKGMRAKAVEREERRRREARENGIVLERATGKGLGKGGKGRRERGVGGPGVGRFKGGTLVLSKREVESIQGKGGGRGRGKKGRR